MVAHGILLCTTDQQSSHLFPTIGQLSYTSVSYCMIATDYLDRYGFLACNKVGIWKQRHVLNIGSIQTAILECSEAICETSMAMLPMLIPH